MILRLSYSAVALATLLVLPLSGARGQSSAPTEQAQAAIPTGDLATNAILEAITHESTEPAPVVRVSEPSHDLPKPFAAFSASAKSLRDSVVALARAQLGRRYRFGGATPEHGFDCSGLVRYVLAALHIDIPRTAQEQARVGASVPRDPTQLKPGDLVTFGSGPQHISHIGIYVGNGRFVQASSRAGRVIETTLGRPLIHGAKPWRGARRVTPDGDPALSDAAELNAEDGGK